MFLSHVKQIKKGEKPNTVIVNKVQPKFKCPCNYLNENKVDVSVP